MAMARMGQQRAASRIVSKSSPFGFFMIALPSSGRISKTPGAAMAQGPTEMHLFRSTSTTKPSSLTPVEKSSVVVILGMGIF